MRFHLISVQLVYLDYLLEKTMILIGVILVLPLLIKGINKQRVLCCFSNYSLFLKYTIKFTYNLPIDKSLILMNFIRF